MQPANHHQFTIINLAMVTMAAWVRGSCGFLTNRHARGGVSHCSLCISLECVLGGKFSPDKTSPDKLLEKHWSFLCENFH